MSTFSPTTPKYKPLKPGRGQSLNQNELAKHLNGNAELAKRWLQDTSKVAASEMSRLAIEGKRAEQSLREKGSRDDALEELTSVVKALSDNDPENASALAAELRESTPEHRLPQGFRNNVSQACIGRHVLNSLRTIGFYKQGNQPTLHFADSMASTRRKIRRFAQLDSGDLVDYVGKYPIPRTEYAMRGLGVMHDVAFAVALNSVAADEPIATPDGKVIPPSYIAVLKQFDDQGGFNHVLNSEISPTMWMAVSAIHDARLFETVVATTNSALESDRARDLAVSYTEFASSKDVAEVMRGAIDTLSRAIQTESQSTTPGGSANTPGIEPPGLER